jgi:hypothetical protein
VARENVCGWGTDREVLCQRISIQAPAHHNRPYCFEVAASNTRGSGRNCWKREHRLLAFDSYNYLLGAVLEVVSRNHVKARIVDDIFALLHIRALKPHN